MSELVPIVVGGALTLVGGAGTEWFRDVRARRRESQDRSETRQREREDFQRETLIELQNAFQRYVRAIGATRHFDEMTLREKGTKTLVPEDLNDELHVSLVLTRKLSSRVNDEQIRDWTEQAIERGTEIVLPGTADLSAAVQQMIDLSLKAQERMGLLIHSL